MAAVAAAGLRGVVDLAALACRHFGIGWLLEAGELPPEVFGGVVLGLGAVRAGEDLGTRLGIQHVVDRGHGAVVEIGRGGPDAVERRRLVTNTGLGRIGLQAFFLGKPARYIVLGDR